MSTRTLGSVLQRGRASPAAACKHLGIVDATIMPIAEDHAGIDHGRKLCQHSTPAIAFDVDEAQQLWILREFSKYSGRIDCLQRPAEQPQQMFSCKHTSPTLHIVKLTGRVSTSATAPNAHLNMSPGDIARVRGQKGCQCEARQWVLEEFAQQVARLLQALELQGVKAVEHLAGARGAIVINCCVRAATPLEWDCAGVLT